jgi:soluble lytic murein transglycosylase-like protein
MRVATSTTKACVSRTVRGLLAIALVLCLSPASADIYSYVDSNGVRHLTNKPDNARYKLVMRTKKRHGRLSARRHQFSATISKVADSVKLDPALIKAVIQAESSFDPNAVSHAGAVGLMQLMPATAARYGVVNRRDPEQNLYGGSRYLKDLMAEFKDLTLALAAYNAGEAAVRKYGNQVPPYEETQTYVKRVHRFYQQYRGS